MNLVELTEAIIKRLVADPETVSVKEFDTEEENTVQIEVLIQEDDMGRVIGKNGKVISGIRTVVQASSSLYDNKKVKINVSSY
ncbi:MAG: KH domain-containing protein [Bacilli bacterium]|jgi:predicted RNA-binding protein YlqC (UPF0109 family)|nr:KH domain-containing protein [Bacilli bacterium]CDE95132.1 uPF0109 protein HMPREF9402_2339 [Clostridium sp. CAG:914]